MAGTAQVIQFWTALFAFSSEPSIPETIATTKTYALIRAYGMTKEKQRRKNQNKFRPNISASQLSFRRLSRKIKAES